MEEDVVMNNYVITIARGLGSGGSHIAKKLSEMLGIPCYDTEILTMASELSGINEAYFFEANEKINKGYIPLNVKGPVYTGRIYDIGDKRYLSDENLFNYQAKIIRTLAVQEKGKKSCIIIGKAANYILRTFPNVLSVNIQSNSDYCVYNIAKRMAMEEAEAAALINQTNKYRATYYKYYTGRKWDSTNEYDLCLNPAELGEETSAEIIKYALLKKLEEGQSVDSE